MQKPLGFLFNRQCYLTCETILDKLIYKYAGHRHLLHTENNETPGHQETTRNALSWFKTNIILQELREHKSCLKSKFSEEPLYSEQTLGELKSSDVVHHPDAYAQSMTLQVLVRNPRTNIQKRVEI